jgi:hypothetical protein
MPALKFSTMVGKATVFEPYKSDPNFSHFVFQLSNSDVGDRQTYDLIIYVINTGAAHPIPLNPAASDWKAISDHHVKSKIILGNLTLNQAKLVELFDKNPGVAFFGFKAEGLGTGDKDRYVQYRVYPCNASGNRTSKIDAFTTCLDPSPPA